MSQYSYGSVMSHLSARIVMWWPSVYDSTDLFSKADIDGSVQDCSVSIAYALEIINHWYVPDGDKELKQGGLIKVQNRLQELAMQPNKMSREWATPCCPSLSWTITMCLSTISMAPVWPQPIPAKFIGFFPVEFIQ